MSSVLRYVDQLVKETSPADDVPRLEMQEGGAVEIKEDISFLHKFNDDLS